MSTVSSTSSSTNVLRITGMATGLDVDSMVEKLMAAEKTKVDKVKQEQQIIEWKQEAYQDIIKDIKDLQSSFYDVTSSDKNILSSSNFAGFNVTGGTASVTSITAGVGAQTGNYTISAISKGAGITNALSGKSLSTTLENINTGLKTNMSLVVNVNGTDKTITLDNSAGGKTLGDLVNAINNQGGGSLTASFSEATGAFSLTTSTIGANTQLTIKNTTTAALSNVLGASNVGTAVHGSSGLATKASAVGSSIGNDKSTSTTLADLGLSVDSDSFDITYNGTTKTISVNKTDKLSDIINNISTTTSGAVTGSFSQLTGKFMIQSANTGSAQSISISCGAGSGKALTALGLADSSNIPNATITQGADATVTITPPGGTATTIVKSTNSFTIDGINYNLSGEGTSTVTVGADNDKVYDKIKSFIDKYNAIVDKIQTKLTEKKNLSYKPLTDTQKEAMKDTEITNWETKAKQGILRDDDNLKKMLNDLRSAFTAPVDGTSFSMVKYGSNSIGLDFGSDRTKPQHIDITDSSKLKQAIATKGDEILKFFTNASTSSDATTANSENGVLTRVKSILENNVGKTGISYNNAVLTKYANKQDDFSINGTSGSNTLPNQIYQKQQLIDTLNKSLSKKQESYYQKFAKLESAMNTLNSQQASLSQLSGS